MLDREICNLLRACTSSGREAFKIVEILFTDFLTALRRDPRLAGITVSEFELIIADARNDFEQLLFREMRDRIHIEDAGAEK